MKINFRSRQLTNLIQELNTNLQLNIHCIVYYNNENSSNEFIHKN